MENRSGCVVLSAGDSKRMLMGEISSGGSSGLGGPREASLRLASGI